MGLRHLCKQHTVILMQFENVLLFSVQSQILLPYYTYKLEYGTFYSSLLLHKWVFLFWRSDHKYKRTESAKFLDIQSLEAQLKKTRMNKEELEKQLDVVTQGKAF